MDDLSIDNNLQPGQSELNYKDVKIDMNWNNNEANQLWTQQQFDASRVQSINENQLH